jgi:hypothetical protein
MGGATDQYQFTRCPYQWLCAINNSVTSQIIVTVGLIAEDSGLLGFETFSVQVVPALWGFIVHSSSEVELAKKKGQSLKIKALWCFKSVLTQWYSITFWESWLLSNTVLRPSHHLCFQHTGLFNWQQNVYELTCGLSSFASVLRRTAVPMSDAVPCLIEL